MFSDTSFLPARQQSEISYGGVGFSLGAVFRPSGSLALAATVRSDGKATVDRDSSRAYSVDLPFTFGAGVQLRPSQRFLASAQATYKTWSGANSDLLSQGGAGAKNTVELAGGFEYTSDPRRPWRRRSGLAPGTPSSPFSSPMTETSRPSTDSPLEPGPASRDSAAAWTWPSSTTGASWDRLIRNPAGCWCSVSRSGQPFSSPTVNGERDDPAPEQSALPHLQTVRSLPFTVHRLPSVPAIFSDI